MAKKEAKKAIQEEKFKSYYELYSKLGTKDGEKNIYKFAKTNRNENKLIINIRNENKRLELCRVH